MVLDLSFRCILVLTLFVAPAYSFPLTGKNNLPQQALTGVETSKQEVIFYSPNFHRHVVARYDERGCYSTILESFLFLDQAEDRYPKARRVASNYFPKFSEAAGLGLVEPHAYSSDPTEVLPSTVVSSSLGAQAGPLKKVIEDLSVKLGKPFLSYFPQEEHDLVCERIQFLLAPLPPLKDPGTILDVPKVFSEGYGAAFSEAQLHAAIISLPHLLSIHPTTALKDKPPIPYFVLGLKITVDQLNAARNRLAQWLDGECAQDSATFAHLYSLGVSWEQCSLVLRAFSSSLISCELQRTFTTELFSLKSDAVLFLRSRFQITPPEVIYMMKTHSRLSGYSVDVLKSHANALQSNLGLSSASLKWLVLRNPSILGVSTAKIALQANFLRNRLKLSQHDIEKVLHAVPSLPEYSLEKNLGPKVDYLVKEVGLTNKTLSTVVVARPSILALSLEKSLKPCVQGLRNKCGLSREELRDAISVVPHILTSKWVTNLEPKIEFLKERLGLNETAVKEMVVSCPRVLMQSVATSLQPKLSILEDAARGDFETVSRVVQNNPSLLVANKATLMRRVSMLQLRDTTFEDAFSSRQRNSDVGTGDDKKRQVLTRRKRPVLEVVDGNTVHEYPDVVTAASATGTSQANMYSILKTGREYNGRTYVYGMLPDIPIVPDPSTPAPNAQDDIPDQDDSMPSLSSLLLESNLQHGPQSNQGTKEVNAAPVYSTVFVSSAVYPSGKHEMRGASKSGAILLYFPQLVGNKKADILLKRVAEDCIPGKLVPAETNAAIGSGGIILSLYPDLRPSRNRCTLFGCRSALRLIVELLASDPTLRDYAVEVDIILDSNFVWELLSDSEALLRWGVHEDGKDFVYDGPEPQWRVNTDLLHPLSNIYYRVTKQMFQTPSLGNRADRVAKDLKIRFCHKSQIAWARDDPVIGRSNEIAVNAAKSFYYRG